MSVLLIILIILFVAGFVTVVYKYPHWFNPATVNFVKNNTKQVAAWVGVWIGSIFIVYMINDRLGDIYLNYVFVLILLTLIYFFFKKNSITFGKHIVQIVSVGILLYMTAQWFGWVESPVDTAEQAEKPTRIVTAPKKSQDHSYGTELGTLLELEPGAEKPVTLPFHADIFYSTTEEIEVRNLSGTTSFIVEPDGDTRDFKNTTAQSGAAQTNAGVWYIKNLGDKKAQVVVTSSATVH